ncbi:hypothetical protein BKA69DRAFT_1082104 [Paraphysoderma sedebokerense]|nr:hypothetical protein BKA69DRAFT_1082104 [Paraphysoderma sedebokerense]
MDLEQALRSHPLFTNGSDDFIRDLTSVMHLRLANTGDMIVKEGEVGKAMFFIIRGSVDVASKDDEVLFATLGQGSFFGEIAVLFDIKRTANVVATSKCFLMSLTTHELDNLKAKYPDMDKRIRQEAEERYDLIKKMIKRDSPLIANVEPKFLPEKRLSLSVDDMGKMAEIVYDQYRTNDMKEILGKTTLFKDASEDILHRLCKTLEFRRYNAGEDIIPPNPLSIPREMYFLKSGIVEVISKDSISTVTSPVVSSFQMDDLNASKSSATSSNLFASHNNWNMEKTITLQPGDFFGTELFMKSSKLREWIRAVTPAEVYVLHKSSVEEVMKEFPDVLPTIQKASVTLSSSLENLRESAGSLGLSASSCSDKKSWASSLSIESLREDRTPSVTTDDDQEDISSTTADEQHLLVDNSNRGRIATLVTQNPTRRRASIAVWTDPRLLKIAGQNMVKAQSRFSQESNNTSSASYETTASSISGSDLSSAADSPIERRNIVHILSHFKVLEVLGEYLDVLDFIHLRLVSKDVIQALDKHPRDYVQSINLSAIHKKVDDGVLVIIGRSWGQNLRTLVLRNCWSITDLGLESLAKHCPRLTQLDLHGCWEITNNGLLSLSLHSPLLTSLDLSNLRKIDDNAISSLINNCHRLEKLTLSYCKAVTNAILGFQGWTRMKKLNFQRCTNVNDRGFQQLRDGLMSLNSPIMQIHTLILSDCSFLTDETTSILAQYCPNLTILSLSFCCALSENAIVDIIKMPNLEILDMSFCGSAVSDNGLFTVATSCSRLTRLAVRGCVRITDNGVGWLWENAKNLAVVNISQCKSVSIAMLNKVKPKWVLLNTENIVEWEEYQSAPHFPSMDHTSRRRKMTG